MGNGSNLFAQVRVKPRREMNEHPPISVEHEVVCLVFRFEKPGWIKDLTKMVNQQGHDTD
jgi:hypothetical protein